MGIVSQKKAERKKQKKARNIQRVNDKRKKHHQLKKRIPLTEQKKKEKQELKQRKLEARQEKKIARAIRGECSKIKCIQEAIGSIFNTRTLDQLGKSLKLIQRVREIKAFPFLYVMSFMFFGNGAISLECLTTALREHFKIIISTTALSNKINSKASVVFLSTIVKEIMKTQLAIALPNHFKEVFSMFSGIKLQDSSRIELNEKLADDFRGSGGASSKSSLKLDFIYDIADLTVHHLKILSGTVPDQALASDILKYVKVGSLWIRDLGYFAIPALRKIANKNAYYLSRLSMGTTVYLKQDDLDPLNIPAFLEKQIKSGNSSINATVYIGKEERFETRLVAEQVPEVVVRQRVSRFKKERKKEPSAHYTEWSGYSIFITNIPTETFSGSMIISMYKIRWQIELVFKNIKSNMQIDIMRGSNKNRIESLLYGKFITILLMFVINNYAAHIAEDREVSCDKLTKWLKCGLRLSKAVLEGSISQLLLNLEDEILKVCKQKRKRKTTCENLLDQYRSRNMENVA